MFPGEYNPDRAETGSDVLPDSNRKTKLLVDEQVEMLGSELDNAIAMGDFESEVAIRRHLDGLRQE